MNNQKIVLNIGSGQSSVRDFTKFFNEWSELRGDIAEINPDIVIDIRTLENISNESVDAIWACHVIEHCHWHEQPMIMNNFRRVLKPDGFAVIIVPNLGSIGQFMNTDLMTPLYQIYNGDYITPMDIIYGYRWSKNSNDDKYNTAMTHKIGFNFSLLNNLIHSHNMFGVIKDDGYQLTALAWKSPKMPDLLKDFDF